jgi:UTP-glucose-1-phosphate uridylyltransferase
LCALLLRGEEPFSVVLPDVLVDQYESDLKIENLAKMIQIFLALFSMVWMQMIVGFGNWVS